MRVVAGPHVVVHAKEIRVAHADLIVNECGVHLAAEVLARQQLQVRAAFRAEPERAQLVKSQVRTGEEMRHPADVVFRGHELQVRKTFQHPTEQQRGKGALHLMGNGHRPQEEIGVIAALSAVACAQVQTERHA